MLAMKPFDPPRRLECGDFVIRAYEMGDGPALLRAVDESLGHLREWMPWAQPDRTLEDTEQLCRSFAAKYLLNEDYVLGIWRDDRLIGGTGYHLRWGPREWKIAEIGMWIHADEAGKGLGTRALAELLRWGFETWEWQRIVWRTDTRNRGSIRVAEKNGLTLEGTLRSDGLDVRGEPRDMHVFAMLKSEWQDSRAGRGR